MYKTITLLLFSVFILNGCTSMGVGIVDGDSFENTTLNTKDYLVSENEVGQVYTAEYYESSLGNNQNKSLLIMTDGKQVNLIEYVVTMTENPGDVFLFENPTITSNGTAVDIYSFKRNATSSPTALIYKNPVITNYGTLIDRDLLTAGKNQGGQIRRTSHHWILKENSTYLITSHNRGGTITELINQIVWYESEIQ